MEKGKNSDSRVRIQMSKEENEQIMKEILRKGNKE